MKFSPPTPLSVLLQTLLPFYSFYCLYTFHITPTFGNELHSDVIMPPSAIDRMQYDSFNRLELFSVIDRLQDENRQLKEAVRQCEENLLVMKEIQLINKEHPRDLGIYRHEEIGRHISPSSYKNPEDASASSTTIAESKNERKGRKLVATVSSDKQVMQKIAPAVTSKLPSWKSNGDPCANFWKGVTCDNNGYIIKISLPLMSLSSKCW